MTQGQLQKSNIPAGLTVVTFRQSAAEERFPLEPIGWLWGSQREQWTAVSVASEVGAEQTQGQFLTPHLPGSLTAVPPPHPPRCEMRLRVEGSLAWKSRDCAHGQEKWSEELRQPVR